jgi:plastocyanin
MRLLGGCLLLACALAGCAGADGPTSDDPVPVVGLRDLDAGADRVGVAGVSLASPLRLQVLIGGVPRSGVLVRWTTTSGTISPETALTDASGNATAIWTPAWAGAYNVTAEVSSPSRRRINFDARIFESNTVLLTTNEGYKFRSARNGSSPAVDTISVGDTMVWRLDPFDYDEHSIETFGAAMPGGDFPYGDVAEVRATYLRPGTFEYRDRVYGGRGTVVVR